MRTVAPAAPATDEPDAHHLILRDGSSIRIRPATKVDAPAMERFFARLSPESRYHRFLSVAPPSEMLVARFCDSSDPRQSLSVVALRTIAHDDCIVAVASYIATAPTTAEVAFAIDDRLQGQGLGTLLLEQLAVRGADHGIRSFVATTSADNLPMREVFRNSGFQVRAETAAGDTDVTLSLCLSMEGVAVSEARRRHATVASLKPLLTPSSLVVIGASNNPSKIGGRILRSIRDGGFKGAVHVVHPSADHVQGIVACRSARGLPSGVDLAILAVPPTAVLSVIDDCADAGIRSLIVVTAGFAEIGLPGITLQKALVEKVRGYGMRLVGPNCMGLMNLSPRVCLNASFSPVCALPGHVAFSSQSGALGIAVGRLASDRAIGLSSFVSVGNKADVSSNDLLEYWEEDSETHVILLYLESFGNPRRFARIARRVGQRKPIVALKAGRTVAGLRAASSHTAALAASDVAVDALFRQTGVIRVDTIDEMLDVADSLDSQPLPRGGRVAIVTNTGGPAILAADACAGAGLEVAELTDETRARLRAHLPATASVLNPIDMIASAGPDEYRAATRIVLAAPEVDAVIVIVTEVDRTQTNSILEAAAGAVASSRSDGIVNKPVLACLVAEAHSRPPLRAGPERIPIYPFPENAVRALGHMAAYARWRTEPQGLFWDFEDLDVAGAWAVCVEALARRGDGWLTAGEVTRLLQACGIALPPGGLARGADDAVRLAAACGFPVAAKIAAGSATHKTDIGGVRLNLENEAAVRGAYAELTELAAQVPATAVEGVVIQGMVTGGAEVLVGVTHDPLFGPLVAFGTGGVEVEVWRDVRFRIAPLTDRDADQMIREIRGFPLLQGFRGRPGVDLRALRDVVLRVSRIAEEIHEIAEIDLNPVIALNAGLGYRVVDARVRVAARI